MDIDIAAVANITLKEFESKSQQEIDNELLALAVANITLKEFESKSQLQANVGDYKQCCCKYNT